tara:strand:+ start:961 stop:1767 length:807 start_codon:yes stop_codon:yes gene_type:complete
MANLKISELTPLGVAPNPNDIIPLTDVDVGVTRSVKISELQAAVQALASNLTDISPIVQANGTMIASNGTNFVSLNTLLPAGLTQIRADLGLGTAATTASTAYGTAAQGAKADTATQPADNISTLTNDSNFIASAGAPVQSVAGKTGTVTVDAGDLTDGDFGGTAILGFDATLNDKTDSYTLLASDAGKVVVLNKGTAVTVTVPSGLGAGFNCSFIQKGAGQVTFDDNSGATTINNRQSHTKIAGQHGVVTLVSTATDVFVLAGDTAS